jgi:hypothetical protein
MQNLKLSRLSVIIISTLLILVAGKANSNGPEDESDNDDSGGETSLTLAITMLRIMP